MKKTISLLAILLHLLAATGQEMKWHGPSVDLSHGRLIVSENQRYLIFEDGTPFFYLGDTAWELLHRLNREETEQFLENRREKGFTVIQAVILAELDGLNTQSAMGQRPLIDNNPLLPNEAYFQHVDWVIQKAAEKGIFMGLLPTWGDKVDLQWGIGPVIFNPANAFAYGAWLGERYRDYPNIIWINGGDRSGNGKHQPVWDALARGIKSKDPNHLMTFHPWGETSSSQWFSDAEWLDFNMVQTGHSQRSYAIYKKLLIPDYALQRVKPVLDGEPRYEEHPVGWQPDILGWFDQADVRQAIYWNLFSGGFGHTYGHHSIWQMMAPGRTPVSHARSYWYNSLDNPGAWSLIHARKLMESRPFTERIPFQSIVQNSYMAETEYIVATRGTNYIFIYIPTGTTAEIDLVQSGWTQIKASWYNPSTGKVSDAGNFPADGIQKFTPPGRGRGNDWVLVLDNPESAFPPPGQ